MSAWPWTIALRCRTARLSSVSNARDSGKERILDRMPAPLTAQERSHAVLPGREFRSGAGHPLGFEDANSLGEPHRRVGDAGRLAVPLKLGDRSQRDGVFALERVGERSRELRQTPARQVVMGVLKGPLVSELGRILETHAAGTASPLVTVAGTVPVVCNRNGVQSSSKTRNCASPGSCGKPCGNLLPKRSRNRP